MDLLQIRAFVLAAKYANFSQVANHMYISQSSISKYISSLESELGFPLFTRGSKAVILTRFGREFLQYAENLLAAEAEASNFIHAQQSSTTQFVVGLTDDLQDGTNIMFFRAYINGIHKFMQLTPSVSVNTKFYPSVEMFRLLRGHKIDLGLVPVIDANFERDFPSTGRHYRLNHISHYLALGPGIPAGASLAEIGKYTKVIYYMPNQVPRAILDQLLPAYFELPKLMACNFSMELPLRMVSGEPCAIALFESHLSPAFRSFGMPVFPLNSVGIGSGLYLVWEKNCETPYTRLLGDLIREQLRQEMRQLYEPSDPAFDARPHQI